VKYAKTKRCVITFFIFSPPNSKAGCKSAYTLYNISPKSNHGLNSGAQPNRVIIFATRITIRATSSLFSFSTANEISSKAQDIAYNRIIMNTFTTQEINVHDMNRLFDPFELDAVDTIEPKQKKEPEEKTHHTERVETRGILTSLD
jgi:hypothetical protein